MVIIVVITLCVGLIVGYWIGRTVTENIYQSIVNGLVKQMEENNIEAEITPKMLEPIDNTDKQSIKEWAEQYHADVKAGKKKY